MVAHVRWNVGINAVDTLQEAIINFANTGDNIIVPSTGGTIGIYRYWLVVGAAVNLVFKDGSNILTGPVPLAANEAMVFTFDTQPWFTISSGNGLIINASGPAQVSGRAYYAS